MDAVQIAQALRDDAVPVVFANVLMQQLGLPVPAVPTMLLAGSLMSTKLGLLEIIAAAAIASVMADWLWYHAGRLFGYRVLAGLCKLSINPSSCVTQTETRFVRWGLSSLLIAKFIPGFSTVAPPIAGALRMHQGGFLMASAAGAALWAGLAILAGWFFQDTVQQVIAIMEQHAASAALFIAVLVATWFSWKIWQRYRFRHFCAVPHITPEELIDLMRQERPPLFLDLRGPTLIAETGPVFGAHTAEQDFLLDTVSDWPKDQPIVTMCACPEDATAVKVARQLLNAGYASVRPLKGGYDAWLKANAHVSPE